MAIANLASLFELLLAAGPPPGSDVAATGPRAELERRLASVRDAE